jgi:Ca2+-binding RTX toxin-like protein
MTRQNKMFGRMTSTSARKSASLNGMVSIFESLEDRRLLSVSMTPQTWTFSDGRVFRELDIVDDNSGEGVELNQKLELDIGPTPDGPMVILGNNGTDTELHGYFDHINVNLGEGNDTFVLRGTGLFMLGTNVQVEGGEGDDNITILSDKTVNVYGGEGNDLLSAKTPSKLAKNVGQGLSGGPGNDTIRGSNGPDMLWGDEGDDKIYGNGGADYIGGGAGNDFVSGGAGNDYILTSLGHDILNGDSGSDTFKVGIFYSPQGDGYIPDDLGDEINGGSGNDGFMYFNDNDRVFHTLSSIGWSSKQDMPPYTPGKG